MQTFDYVKAESTAQAVREAATSATAQQGASVRFLAGGTTLYDLMKLDVETPTRVVDISGLGLDRIEDHGGGLKIGAMVRNADLAHDPRVVADHAVLSEALLAGASGQLRNMATTGGNLLQRTRCLYFRDAAMPCNKRVPGSGCPAIHGANVRLAILGTSEQCIATNPSDMNVALTALDATIVIQGATDERTVPIGEFFVLPGDAPQRETVLQPGDLITHVLLPKPAAGRRTHYLKLRDRASYEFALASAAITMTMDAGTIGTVGIAMGGVGTRPWRMPEAEQVLIGQVPAHALFRKAADAGLAAAIPRSQNAFKIELAARCLVAALDRITRA